MYQIGEYVVKANSGLCRVEDITHLEGMSVDKKKLYYLLIPLSNEQSKLYVPVDRDRDAKGFRKVMTEEEAWELINHISKIDEIRIDNEKQREQKYKEAVRECNPVKLVGIIKTMYFRKKKRDAQGKKTTAMDERYFRIAEEHLYEELAFALGKKKSEMCAVIKETIEKN